MDKEIIRTIQPFCWNATLNFLLSFNNCALMQDEGFANIYRQIYDYVTSKLKLDTDGDISDVYVVVEQ